LGLNQDLKWHTEGKTLAIEMPKDLEDPVRRPCQQAYALKVESQPWE
jgi:hypothetical protein